MTNTVTSRDVQEIVSKLDTDKAKPREVPPLPLYFIPIADRSVEGIKLLNAWLEGERSIAFCKFVGHNTALLKPNEIPHSLVLLYIGKVEMGLSVDNSGQLNPKEEVFRCILTLHALLENPPGDFPDNLREDIVKGFAGIFSCVRDEGKVSRKLIECINTYLLRDGPNLGCQSLEIHDAVQQFVFRCWITTHDRGLKDALVLYAKLQLKLTRGAADGRALLEQLLDVGLSSVLLLPVHGADNSPRSSSTINERQLMVGFIFNDGGTTNTINISDAVITIFTAMLPGLTPMLALGNDPMNALHISQDLWDLRGDLRDALHLRQNLLRTVLALLNWKEKIMFNERMVMLLPAAVYALCAGCASLHYCVGRVSPSNFFGETSEAAENRVMAEEHEHESSHLLFECSVEVLAEINPGSTAEVSQSDYDQSVRLPRQLRDPLLHDTEICILEAAVNAEIEKMLLSDVVFLCALLSNFIPRIEEQIWYETSVNKDYISNQEPHRPRKEVSSFLTKMGCRMLALLDRAASTIENYCNDIRCGSFGTTFIFDSTDSILASFESFTSSPFYSNWSDQNTKDTVPYTAIIQSIERLVRALAELFEGLSGCSTNLQSEIDLPDSSNSHISFRDFYPLNSSRSMIVDMELDMNDDAKDVDMLSVAGKNPSGLSFCAVNRKLDLMLIISTFFSVLPAVTWDILFNLMEKESDLRVLYASCYVFRKSKHPNEYLIVISISNVVDERANLKLECLNVLGAISCLLKTLISRDTVAKDKDVALSENKRVSEQSLISLGDLVNRVAQNDLFDWIMIEKLLMMLRDPEYRVRFSLARRIGVLFQTWDGHDELFQDICSNFGIKLVVSSKEKVVTANEVLTAGPHPRPLMETIIITIMHLALHSEKIELEAVFMMCVVAAIDPCQRELVGAVLDNLSKKLQYTTRSKYMEELIGPILFFWVACGVSLVALVETRDLFVCNVEPVNFVQYCCHWLLPALLLHGDISNLKWVAKVACQPSATLVKNHFVPIFSVCMALHCSKRSSNKYGAATIQSSILSVAEISENERDKLIKKRWKRLVSIVSHILSLASCASDPVLPFFSRDTVGSAIQTVVDGEHRPGNFGVIDKINIFRPDRVFMFIVEMHYKITAATHYRHKCNRLAGIEVLINVIGHRAAVSSTFKLCQEIVLMKAEVAELLMPNVVVNLAGRKALDMDLCKLIALK
ncbi:hypothetical protein RJ639_034032, partial [Escallonia herrerae]